MKILIFVMFMLLLVVCVNIGYVGVSGGLSGILSISIGIGVCR